MESGNANTATALAAINQMNSASKIGSYPAKKEEKKGGNYTAGWLHSSYRDSDKY